MAERLTTKQFIKESIAIHGDKYDYSKVEYINWKTRVTIICPVHGEFTQTPNKHKMGRGCNKCSVVRSSLRQSSSTVEFIQKAVAIHGDEYDYSKVRYVSAISYVEIICQKHGSFQQIPNNHLKGYGCNSCAAEFRSINQTSSREEFIQKAVDVHGDKYDYSKIEYTNCRNKIIIICPKHGEFKQTPDCHIQGQGCPNCVVRISKPHTKISGFLESLDIVFIDNDRSVLSGREIDIWIPEYQFGIEINGCYWHGTNNKIENTSSKHLDKFSLARSKGISLYQFWDHEVDEKFEIIKSMILHKLGKSKRIFARKCVVEKSDNSIRHFMDQSHLQGHRNASQTYCLKIDDKIVAALTFSRHNKHDWEIIRYACALGHTVVGGFSRLFKAFIKEHHPKQVMTFADARHSLGDVYSNNGFSVVGHSKPNYFYVKGRNIFSRQKCQKHRLARLLSNGFDPSESETNNMLNNGFTKVYDAGHHKLIWNK